MPAYRFNAPLGVHKGDRFERIAVGNKKFPKGLVLTVKQRYYHLLSSKWRVITDVKNGYNNNYLEINEMTLYNEALFRRVLETEDEQFLSTLYKEE